MFTGKTLVQNINKMNKINLKELKMTQLDLTKPNAPTFKTQNKVRTIIKKAAALQEYAYFKDQELKDQSPGLVFDILGYITDNVPGTKRVLYSLDEYTGNNYSAMYHLAHAKPLSKNVIKFLKKELAFLAPEEAK